MVYSSLSFVGLFHPTAAFEIHLSGVFPVTKPLHLIDAPSPLAVSKEPLLRELPLLTPVLPCPAYRVLLLVSIRCRKLKGLTSAAFDPLLGF
jgi:hypothetical protein